MSTRALALGAALLWVASAASAQSAVYRCGNEYSRMPCSQGTVIDTQNSARTAVQRAEASRVAAAERKLADDMARDRLRAQAAIKPASAGSLGAVRPTVSQAKAPTAPKAKKKKKDSTTDSAGDFVTIAPKPRP